jgi:alkyl hydroperoxide reductase subunit AhpC
MINVNATTLLDVLGAISYAAQIQKAAPNFQGTAVVNNDFKEIKLADYKGKYLILFFYPLDL